MTPIYLSHQLLFFCTKICGNFIIFLNLFFFFLKHIKNFTIVFIFFIAIKCFTDNTFFILLCLFHYKIFCQTLKYFSLTVKFL